MNYIIDEEELKVIKKIEVLESKLASIKYLNREEVENIIRAFAQEDITYTFNNLTTDGDTVTKNNVERIKKYAGIICSLAIEIDKEKIVKVFDKVIYIPYTNGVDMAELLRIENIENLATEIIKEIGVE